MIGMKHVSMLTYLVMSHSTKFVTDYTFCLSIQHLHRHGTIAINLKDYDQLLGVFEVEYDSCAFGLKSRDSAGEGFAKKRTRVLTNLACLAELLKRDCPGGHRHVQLLQSRAGPAAVYPFELCEVIAKAIEMISSTRAQEIYLGNLSINELHEESFQDVDLYGI